MFVSRPRNYQTLCLDNLKLTFLRVTKKNLHESKPNALSFYRSPNVLCWSKFFEPAQKFIYILCQSQTFCARQKKWFAFSKIGFCAGTKVFEEALNAVKFLDRHKTFWAGPNFLCQTKNLFTYCGSHQQFVPDKKMICIQ